MFLCETKKLTEIKEKKILIEKTLKIIEEFLLTDSKKEINISGKAKNKIINVFELYEDNNKEEWLFEETSDKLFSNIQKIVRKELYHDTWRRFLRTEEALKLTKKYSKDSTVCSPKITEKFNYSDDYFQHIFTFESDFKFGSCLFEDDFHWEVFFDCKLKYFFFIES